MIIYHRFEWDLRESSRNLTKHGVSFKEASTVFADQTHSIEPDGAARFRATGRSDRGRALVVTHEVGPRIRILGAEHHDPDAARPAPEPPVQVAPPPPPEPAQAPAPELAPPPAAKLQKAAKAAHSTAKAAAPPAPPAIEPAPKSAPPAAVAATAKSAPPAAPAPTRRIVPSKPTASKPVQAAAPPPPPPPPPPPSAPHLELPAPRVDVPAAKPRREPRPGSWRAAARALSERLARESAEAERQGSST